MKTTKRIFTLWITLLFVSVTSFAQDNIWKADMAHSKIRFGTVHNTISDVEGLFKEYDARITSSEEDFSDAIFVLVIDVQSLDTEIEMRDNHLRSADFFNAEKYPEITYKSTSIEKADEEDHYTLKGDLTIKDITKPVVMDMWYRGTIENDKGHKIAGFQITGKLNRLDFNVGEDFPKTVISNEVYIKADGEFIKQ